MRRSERPVQSCSRQSAHLHHALPVLQQRHKLGDEGVQVWWQQLLVAVLAEVDHRRARVCLQYADAAMIIFLHSQVALHPGRAVCC